MNVIELRGLTRRFGDFTAVDSLDLVIEEGSIFGLLGPNGAGKSTTLNMLCTMLRPTEGHAFIDGMDVDKKPHDVRQMIGIVFQDPTLDSRLTGRENLEMHAELYNVEAALARERINELLSLVELEDKAGEIVRNYSGGMRRRLEIARGLIHHPKVLFLDEPTIGLDPQTRAKIWDYVKKLSEEENITILLTTHYMEEAQTLCDRIGIIDHGKIVALGSPEDLIREVGEEMVLLELVDASKADLFRSADFVEKVYPGKRTTLVLRDGPRDTPKLFSFAAENGIAILSMETYKPTLNDVFLRKVGRDLREEHAENKDKLRTAMRRRGMGR